jgi:RNA polymerase sigma factor (sigma-70 family)
MDIDWAQLVLNETFFQRINKLVRRSIFDECAAEEAFTYIIHTLSENNWEKCRGFSGKSAPENFLYSVSGNLIIDYSRKLYGRQRPPAWLQRKGQLWLSIWKELCLDRHPGEMVISRHFDSGFRDRDMLEQIVRTIKGKLPWCGESKRPESLDAEYGPDLNYMLFERGNQDSYRQEGFFQALEFAHLLLEGSDGATNQSVMSENESQVLSDVITSIKLTAEEKLILKMRFCDGMSFSAIARALDMAKHQPAHLIKKILERVRERLIDSGIDIESSDVN